MNVRRKVVCLHAKLNKVSHYSEQCIYLLVISDFYTYKTNERFEASLRHYGVICKDKAVNNLSNSDL